ncbi:MAG TPA: response regulator, partial [Methanomicrobiales archaeon]|nr:response regulator [Methanomicrobiales archaeon]
MSRARILVVEDEFITAADLEARLGEMGFEVPACVDNGPAAIEKAGELRPDIILMDITLVGGMSGIEAAARIKELYGIPVIFLTAHSEEPTFERALKASPYGYVIKPFDPLNLRAIIDMALYKHQMEERLEESERTIRSLLNAVPDALVLANGDRRVVAGNDAMAARLGKGRADLPGIPLADLVSGTGLGITPDQVDEIYRKGSGITVEVNRGGRWYQTALYPVAGAAGAVDQVVLQSRDITDLREIKERLKAEGVSRIRTTLDQCQALNDQIAASLQAIRTIIVAGNPGSGTRVEEELHRITSSVNQLDLSYARSERA